MKTLLGNDVCSAAPLDDNDMNNDDSQNCSDAERDDEEDISNHSDDKNFLFMPTVAGITGNSILLYVLYKVEVLFFQ